MKLYDVYPLFDIEPVAGQDVFVTDNKGVKYLDLYGGHAVISIGHSHPKYVNTLSDQLHKIGFYSNSVKMPLQEELAIKLGNLSGYKDYALFLCNSGAEANENALKLASFTNNRRKIVAVKKAFHGRTSLSVACTDNPSIHAEINKDHSVVFVEMNDVEALKLAVDEDVCAVIIEGIQGVGGVHVPNAIFLETARELCNQSGALLILDEIQSGYGRSGYFFAHQHSPVKPDIITIAKGMGNGFPIAGILVSPKIQPKHGQLGTTFGGNHLACAAGITVLDVIKEEKLIENAQKVGAYLIAELKKIKEVKEVRGMGLMIGIELPYPSTDVRHKLLFEHKIFTGSSSEKNTLRILPPLTLKIEHADMFLQAFKKTILNPEI
jgi:acetylornithine/N-succinyldiaminopimelate aminotransferase